MEACGTEGAEHVAEKTKTRKTREQKRKEKNTSFSTTGGGTTSAAASTPAGTAPAGSSNTSAGAGGSGITPMMDLKKGLVPVDLNRTSSSTGTPAK